MWDGVPTLGWWAACASGCMWDGVPTLRWWAACASGRFVSVTVFTDSIIAVQQ